MLAISCGAEVIEKHIALEHQTKGLDIDFSLKGSEIKQFRSDIDSAHEVIGQKKFLRKKMSIKVKILEDQFLQLKIF